MTEDELVAFLDSLTPSSLDRVDMIMALAAGTMVGFLLKNNMTKAAGAYHSLYSRLDTPISQIKPLAWEHFSGPEFLGGHTAIAETIFGKYQVWGDGSWKPGWSPHQVTSTGGIEVGIETAEIDYQNRIKSTFV
jgi:hypothetical protein